MIKVHNLRLLKNVPFDEYLEIPRTSYSSIKSNGVPFKPTAKMQLGTAVHNYLSDPANFTGDIEIVRPLAIMLKNHVGDHLWNKFEKEVTVLADLEYDGKILQYKGRIDLLLYKYLVADLKAAERITRTVNYFGYPKQVSGYCIPTNTPTGIILSVSPTVIDPKTKMNRVDKFIVDPNDVIPDSNITYTEWWEEKIFTLGKSIKSYINN